MGQDCQFCQEHSGAVTKTAFLERENETQWKAIDAIREKMDGMKNWIIGVLVTVLVQLIFTIGSFVIQKIQ